MRVSQKQIAKKLGYHPATICLALKNHPSIPPETRERILKAAAKLGYQRDPMLGALAAYRRALSPPTFQAVLSWLVSTAEGIQWSKASDYHDYYLGARARAAELGYKVEIIDLVDYRDHAERLGQVLRARGTRGIFICPQPQARTEIKIDLTDLSSVTFGYTVKSPAIHAVSSHHYLSVIETFQRLRAAGYRRIGYALSEGHDERLENRYLAGFLVEQSKVPEKERVPPLGPMGRSKDQFCAWIRRYEPDALMIEPYVYPEYLKSMRIRIPEELGVAVLGLIDGTRQFSGVDEGSKEIGRVAAEFLISMIERGETGLPTRPQRLLVNGIWREGKSLLTVAPQV